MRDWPVAGAQDSAESEASGPSSEKQEVRPRALDTGRVYVAMISHDNQSLQSLDIRVA